MAGTFDYFAALNLGWMAVLSDPLWADTIIRSEILLTSPLEFRERASAVSNFLKTHEVDNCLKFLFFENTSLLGYQTLPFPGFDIFEQARDLATGTVVHDFPPGMDFETQADRWLHMPPAKVTALSFRQFIQKGTWRRSGSSSIGHLQFTLNGETHKIKARKNLVLDIIEVDALLALTVATKEQEHTVIVKSELGKVRIAVAADLTTYLKMSWLLHMLGDSYIHLNFSTQNESFTASTKRLQKFNENCGVFYNLPADYKSFDHQLRTEEIEVIYKILIKRAIDNAGTQLPSDFIQIQTDVLNSFAHATLRAEFGEKHESYHISKGLMSGLLITSIIGNTWSTVMCGTALDCLQATGADLAQVDLSIRGDDAAAIFPTLKLAQGFTAVLVGLGAVLSPGKFSISKASTEFLRTWFDGLAHGYPARVIAGLTQRKPWSSEPWTDVSFLTNLTATIGTLTRRGLNTAGLYDSMLETWALKHNVSVKAMKVPRALGGLGLGVWDGSTLKSPFPRQAEPHISASITNHRRDALLDIAASMHLPVQFPALDQLALRQVATALSTDDVPAYVHEARLEFSTALRNQPPTLSATKTPADPTISGSSASFPRLETLQELFPYIRTRAEGSFGLYRGYKLRVDQFKAVKEALTEPLSLRQFIKQDNPGLYSCCSRKYSHFGEALDWYLGSTPILGEPLHPELHWLNKRLTTSGLYVTRFRGGSAALSLQRRSALCRNHIANLPWVVTNYMW